MTDQSFNENYEIPSYVWSEVEDLMAKFIESTWSDYIKIRTSKSMTKPKDVIMTDQDIEKEHKEQLIWVKQFVKNQNGKSWKWIIDSKWS